MIHRDTVLLLRECDAGVRMGVSSLKQVSGRVRAAALADMLENCRKAHSRLAREIERSLSRFGDGAKQPLRMALAMSKAKTAVCLFVKPGDASVASLMTDGCNMGVKSLSRYLNQYKAADEDSKAVAAELIKLEADLAKDLRGFL